MKRFFLLVFMIFTFMACSNTWQGVKDDSSNAYRWSKKKIHDATRE